MNTLQQFTNPAFGTIRTTVVNGEPRFVLKDVCEAFGETNYRRVASRLEGDEKGVSQIDTPGGKQSMTTVSEPGLYSTLFAMQPEKARGVSDEYIAKRQTQLRQFKRWVTSEVLPAIRRHGMYADAPTVEKMLDDPDTMIRTLQALKEEREKRRALEQQAEADKPKVLFADAVSASRMRSPVVAMITSLRFVFNVVFIITNYFQKSRKNFLTRQNNGGIMEMS